ncbi:MAG: hypothetical protein HY804_07910 [Nitrospinae bacterium]|nr:hypothetical protein [Nitrospinota bacterium]
MKRVITLFSALALALVGVMATPDVGSAIPNFARQTGNPCFACHFQNIPKLNAYGRAFKLGGYTDASTPLLEDENLSTPATMPLGFVVKLRYQQDTKKTSSDPKKGTERGEWQLPDEAALWMAGRVNQNIGYAVEFPGGWASGKVVFSAPIGDNRIGLSVYSTDALGYAFGMEPFNTGVLRSIRMFEHRGETSVFQKQGYGSAAQGITLYAGGNMFFAAAGLWGPVFDHADAGFDLAMNYRLAVTPTLGGWDTMIGIAGTAGKVKCAECAEFGLDGDVVTEVKTESFGVDFQAQGELGGMQTEIQAMYGSVGADDVLLKKSTGYNVNAQVNFNPMVGVALGYGSYTDKSGSADKDTTAISVLLPINLSQKLTRRPEYTSYSGDGRSRDNLLTIMLFGGF